MINNQTDLKDTKMHYNCQFFVVVLSAFGSKWGFLTALRQHKCR